MKEIDSHPWVHNLLERKLPKNNCWELVRIAYFEEYGYSLPEHIKICEGNSISKDKLKSMDIVLLSSNGKEYNHVGIYLDFNAGMCLNTIGEKVFLLSFTQLKRHGFSKLKFYRIEHD